MEKRSLYLVMGVLMTCLLLSALDQTVVSTALPTIVGDLGGLENLSWVVTAYLLSSTASVPLFGKISDIYGRKVMLQATIVIFLVGSVLAGMSQTMIQLIITRGIQGIGGGGLLAMTFTVLGDILSPRERGKYTGYFTAVFASSSILGPLIGGFFVDHLSWRWVFYVNLPLGVVAMVVVAKFLHTPVPSERRSIDFLGAGLMTAAVSSLMLASVWGGNQYPWGSPTIVLLGAGGLALTIMFLLHEGRHPDPILPLRMFRDPVFRVCITQGALVGSVMVGAAAFLPVFLQVALGASATSSGFLLVPMMGGVVVGSNVAGRIVNATGRYKVFPILGLGASLVGMLLLTQLEATSSRSFVSVAMAILGLGIGTAMPIMTLAVQNTAPAGDMGAATASVNFFRSLGSTFGVALFGALLNSKLDADKGLLNSPGEIRKLPTAQFNEIVAGITDGLVLIFQIATPLVLIAFVLAWFLKEVPLRDDVEMSPGMVEGMEEAGMFVPPSEHVAPMPDDMREPEGVTPGR